MFFLSETIYRAGYGVWLEKENKLRLREKIGQQACIQPGAQVAKAFAVSPRFVQTCLEAVATSQIE